MTALVLAGFVLAIAAPALHARMPRWSGRLLAAYPAAGLVLLLGERLPGAERTAWVPALGVELSFALDGLSRLFALLITGIGTLVLGYAAAYMAGHPREGRFYSYLLAFMASMLGLVLADNILALFLFWELTSITSFLLIGFEQQRPAARAAALQALYVTAGGGLALLAGLLLLAQAGGSSSLSVLALSGDAIRESPFYMALLLLILAGAFTKSAQAPFHFWLPNAMEAPTPVSAYLHSSTMVKAGVYLLARLHPALGGTTVWLTLVGGVGAVTAVSGALLAWRQTDLKRILAYSTVSALGMMTMLLGLGTDLALQAAVLLILAHALYKGALFLVAGTVDHEAGERDIRRLGGLRGSMPLTAAAAALAALSMAGVPPFGGFLAKELMLEAALHGPAAAGAAAVLFVTSVLLGAVALLVGFRPFFGAATEPSRRAHEGSPGLSAGALLLAISGAAAGLMPGLFADPLTAGAAAVIGSAPSAPLTLWHGLTPPLFIGVAAIAGAVLLVRLWRGADAAAAPAGFDRFYATGLQMLAIAAERQTRVLQSGYLRHYLLTTIGAAVVLGGGTLVLFRLPIGWTGERAHLYEYVLLVLILLSALAAARASSRVGAVAALGTTGYAVALVYVTYGAPDLAMTQFVIETLTVALFLFAMRGLPGPAFRTVDRGRVRDALVAGAAGVLMTWLVIAATSRSHAPPISDYFLEQSVPAAHGRNVVNVILVDFRALDTLGEISVLALAGIGVYALLRLAPRKEAAGR